MKPWKPTSKQQAFVDAILVGNNQSDAYRLAYATDNMLPVTITRNATTLMQDNNIATLVATGRQVVQAQNVATRERILEELATIAYAELPPGSVRPTDKANALDKMAKVAGFYAEPERGADKHPINITHVTVVLSHGKQETRQLETRETIVDADSEVVAEE